MAVTAAKTQGQPVNIFGASRLGVDSVRRIQRLIARGLADQRQLQHRIILTWLRASTT